MNRDSDAPSLFPDNRPFGEGLYGGLPPHQGASETSKKAADVILPRLGRLQKAYLAYLHVCGPTGATDHNAAAGLGRPLSSICARRNELMKFDPPLVRDSGRTRTTNYGGTATVWILNPEQGARP